MSGTWRPVHGAADPDGDAVPARIRALTRRAFLAGGGAALATLGGWRWLATHAAEEDGLAWPLRRVLAGNEALTRGLVSPGRLAPTFPRSAVGELRVNGTLGLDEDAPAPGLGTIQLLGAAGGARTLDIAAVRALPRTELITELKCIEGWSTVARFAGTRFADFARAYPPPTRSGRPLDATRPGDAPPYVSLATPDGEYYVGLDTASALHPQTLLAWELDGAPLTAEHGAPLRLVVPVKYGTKNIKRIGTIAWATRRPADYWAERGYDWFAGL